MLKTKTANKSKMATPHSGLVALPFWWFNPVTRIGTPAMRVGITISQTFDQKICAGSSAFSQS